MWVFAYGSLMWRPGFAYRRVEPARLDGWVRRFWQGSTDHRGTPEAPGRVVTLLRDARGHCIGVAYQIDVDGAWSTMSGLDFREKGGYQRERLQLVLQSGAEVAALTYVARPDNPNYLGPDRLERMAQQILSAHGPSGANLDYLRRLESALVRARATDLHVGMLMAAVRRELSATGDVRFWVGRQDFGRGAARDAP